MTVSAAYDFVERSDSEEPSGQPEPSPSIPPKLSAAEQLVRHAASVVGQFINRLYSTKNPQIRAVLERDQVLKELRERDSDEFVIVRRPRLDHSAAGESEAPRIEVKPRAAQPSRHASTL
jgi:hypothetical protein